MQSYAIAIGVARAGLGLEHSGVHTHSRLLDASASMALRAIGNIAAVWPQDRQAHVRNIALAIIDACASTVAEQALLAAFDPGDGSQGALPSASLQVALELIAGGRDGGMMDLQFLCDEFGACLAWLGREAKDVGRAMALAPGTPQRLRGRGTHALDAALQKVLRGLVERSNAADLETTVDIVAEYV